MCAVGASRLSGVESSARGKGTASSGEGRRVLGCLPPKHLREAACPPALLSLETAVQWLRLLFLEVVCHSK